jgi:hypothetical protein
LIGDVESVGIMVVGIEEVGMAVLMTRRIVEEAGNVSVTDAIPPGEHLAAIGIADAPVRRRALRSLRVDDFPLFHLGRWPTGTTLRREELYGDDGR